MTEHERALLAFARVELSGAAAAGDTTAGRPGDPTSEGAAASTAAVEALLDRMTDG